jgi:hypothetical protein
MIDRMDTSSFLLAVEGFLAVRPRPSTIIADNGTNFRGGDSALTESAEKNQIDLGKAQTYFNIEFKFAPTKAPHFQGLVKRFVAAAKSALHSTVQAHTLTDEELRTAFARAMGHLNNIPIAYMIKRNADFQYQQLIPFHFLIGAAYNKLQPKDGNARLLSKAARHNRVCGLLNVFWKRLVAELSNHLRSYNTCISKTRGVEVGDFALLLEPKKRGTAPLVRIRRPNRTATDMFDKSPFLTVISTLPGR